MASSAARSRQFYRKRPLALQGAADLSTLFIIGTADRMRGMTTNPATGDPIQAIALLDEPNRRRLYAIVTSSPEPVGRDDAAATLDISRELAAFHLDRLVDGGLLQVEYRRRGGRSGPGAGRPAKLYRRADREVTVALPPRRYDVAADLMATAIERLSGDSGVAVVADVARDHGRVVGRGARRKAGGRPARRRLLTELSDLLGGAGFEPAFDAATGTLSLRNCPYHALVAEHRGLTCGMNLAWAEGIIDGLGVNVRAELAPAPDRCCVVFGPGSGHDATATESRSEALATAHQTREDLCLTCGHEEVGETELAAIPSQHEHVRTGG